MKTILKCGLLFDATREDCLKKDMAVVVEGDRISEVLPLDEVNCNGADVIDLGGSFVMPGLIDAHVHIQFNRDPGGRSVVYGLSVGEIAIKSLATANIDLMAGFTTLRVMSAQANTDVAVKRSIEKGWAKRPRLYCSGEPLGSTGGNGDTSFREDIVGGALGHLVNGPMEARRAAREVFKRGADQIKLSAAHTYDAQSIRNAVEAGADTIDTVFGWTMRRWSSWPGGVSVWFPPIWCSIRCGRTPRSLASEVKIWRTWIVPSPTSASRS